MAEDSEQQSQKQVSETAMISAIRQRAAQMAVPESWIKNAIKRIQLGESDRQELAAELTLRYDLSESQANWMLLEGEEQKAENILATKDMVEKVTHWIENVSAMKSEELLELLDSIRIEQGSDVAQRFNDAVKGALDGIYAALEAGRQGLTQGLSIV